MNNKIVTLPLADAVKLAAQENLERDMRMGLIDYEMTDEDRDMYIEEALAVLVDTGQNYDPEYDDHHMIYLKKE